MKTIIYFLALIFIIYHFTELSQLMVDIKVETLDNYKNRYNNLISDTINIRPEVLYYKYNKDSVEYINKNEKLYLEHRIKDIEIIKLNDSVYKINN